MENLIKGLISYPVTRQAAICKADVDLTDTTSQRVVRYIVDHSELFLARIASCFDEFDGQPRRSSERIKLVSAKPPVISFPSFDVRLGEYIFRSRVSLTVCWYGRRSKIWHRTSLFRCNDQPANELSEDTTTSFYALAERLSEALIGKVFLEYRKSLQKTGLASELFKRYAIRIRGFNTGDSRTKDVIAGFSSHSISSFNQVLEQEELFSGLAGLFRLTLGKSSVTRRDIQELADSPRFDVSFLEGASNRRPVRSVVVARPGEAITYLDCVCHSSRVSFSKGLPVDLAQQELVKEYASQF